MQAMLHTLLMGLVIAATTFAFRTELDRRATLDAFIAAERDIAVNGMLANIGPNGALAANASRGVVIGQP